MPAARRLFPDRKSTRLNSSHLGISYAVPPYVHSFPTRRSSDLPWTHTSPSCAGNWRPIPPTRCTSSRSARLATGSPFRRKARPKSICLRRFQKRIFLRHAGGAPAFPRSEEHTSELQSLRHLVCRPPICTLFPYTTLFRSTVDTHIAELRRKLEADPANPLHIVTVRKVGYRLAVQA